MVGVQRAFVFLSELDFKSDIQSFRVMWQLLQSKHQVNWSKYKWILKQSFFWDTMYIITCKQICRKQKITTSNAPSDVAEVQPLLLEKPRRAENRMRAFLAFTRGFSQTCTNKQNLPPYVFSGYIKEKIDRYTNIVPSASWKTLFAILRTISNFNLDWEAPTVSPICKIGFAPPHKVLLRFFLRSVSSKTFGPFAKYHFWRSSASLFGRDQICSAEVPDQNWCFTKLSSSWSSFSSSDDYLQHCWQDFN